MALSFLLNIWWLLVLIGVMILIHELGHFWAARAFDVKVEVFSFGFGPRLFGFRRGETDYRFSLILFGGYVKMTGEQPGDPAADDPREVEALASSVNELMLSIASRAPNADSTHIAVLACLHLADKLRLLEHDLASLKERVDR